MTEITNAIDELSDLKSLRQLAKENAKAREANLEIKRKTEVQEYRLEQANLQMKKIEETERDRCRKTAELLKEFEQHSGNGPFFESLINLLMNFQGLKS